MRVTFSEVEPDDRQRVRDALERYCGVDTLGMAQIVQSLNRLTEPACEWRP